MAPITWRQAAEADMARKNDYRVAAAMMLAVMEEHPAELRRLLAAVRDAGKPDRAVELSHEVIALADAGTLARWLNRHASAAQPE